jgi:hypothetical protein
MAAAETETEFGRAGTKKARTREVVFNLLRQHEAEDGGIPTSGRFVFYELDVVPQDVPNASHRRAVAES